MSARVSNSSSSISVPVEFLREAATTQEVETYLLAVASYPAQLEIQRDLTFEQHLYNLLHAQQRSSHTPQ